MKLGMVVGPGHLVLDGDPAPPKRGTTPIFGPCLLWQVAGWIKVPLGMEIGLGPGHTVLDVDPQPPKGAQPQLSVVAKRLDGSRYHLVGV